MSDNTAKPANAVSPRVVPRRDAPEPMTVEARLVWPGGRDEWVDAKALRWNRDHVLVEVSWRPIKIWLPADDVRRGTQP